MQISGNRPSFGQSTTQRKWTSDLGETMQRVIRGEPKAATSKAIELSFRPLLPLILASAGLLYNQGMEATKQNGGEQNAWLRILGEAGLGYAVLNATSGVFPLFGIALAAYRSGKQDTALDKIKACVNTAVTLSMGALGVNIFKGMSEADRRFDNEMLFNTLRDDGATNKERTAIANWIQTLQNHPEQEHRALGESLTKLKTSLKENTDNFKKQQEDKHNPKWLEESGAIRERIKNAKEEVTSQFSKLGKEAVQGLDNSSGRLVHNFMSTIHYSGSSFVGAIRTMNPIFGYIIMGLMLGSPLASAINHWIDKKRPDLKNRKMEKAIIPQHNRLINAQPVYGGALNSNRPYMVWPGVNGDRPLR